MSWTRTPHKWIFTNKDFDVFYRLFESKQNCSILVHTINNESHDIIRAFNCHLSCSTIIFFLLHGQINMEIVRLLNSLLHTFIRHCLNTPFVFPTNLTFWKSCFMRTCTLIYFCLHILLKVDNLTLAPPIRSNALFIAFYTLDWRAFIGRQITSTFCLLVFWQTSWWLSKKLNIWLEMCSVHTNISSLFFLFAIFMKTSMTSISRIYDKIDFKLRSENPTTFAKHAMLIFCPTILALNFITIGAIRHETLNSRRVVKIQHAMSLHLVIPNAWYRKNKISCSSIFWRYYILQGLLNFVWRTSIKVTLSALRTSRMRRPLDFL